MLRLNRACFKNACGSKSWTGRVRFCAHDCGTSLLRGSLTSIVISYIAGVLRLVLTLAGSDLLRMTIIFFFVFLKSIFPQALESCPDANLFLKHAPGILSANQCRSRPYILLWFF